MTGPCYALGLNAHSLRSALGAVGIGQPRTPNVANCKICGGTLWGRTRYTASSPFSWAEKHIGCVLQLAYLLNRASSACTQSRMTTKASRSNSKRFSFNCKADRRALATSGVTPGASSYKGNTVSCIGNSEDVTSVVVFRAIEHN